MDTEKIIKEKPAFLIDEYDFTFSSASDGCRNYYIFENKHGKIVFYEWAERGEKEATVYFDNEAKKIDFFLENPKQMAVYNKRCSGVRGLFFDGRAMYWGIVADTIKHSILLSGSVFGLQIV